MTPTTLPQIFSQVVSCTTRLFYFSLLFSWGGRLLSTSCNALMSQTLQYPLKGPFGIYHLGLKLTSVHLIQISDNQEMPRVEPLPCITNTLVTFIDLVWFFQSGVCSPEHLKAEKMYTITYGWGVPQGMCCCWALWGEGLRVIS